MLNLFVNVMIRLRVSKVRKSSCVCISPELSTNTLLSCLGFLLQFGKEGYTLLSFYVLQQGDNGERHQREMVANNAVENLRQALTDAEGKLAQALQVSLVIC